MDTFFRSFTNATQIRLDYVEEWANPIKLQHISAAFEKKYGEPVKTPTAMELGQLSAMTRELYSHHGASALQSIPCKQIKRLPWILYEGKAGNRIVDEVNFIQAILAVLATRKLSSLEALVRTYLMNYDESAAGHQLVRTYLEESLTNYSGYKSRIKDWQVSRFLFAVDGIKQTAEFAKSKAPAVKEYTESIGLSGSLANGRFMQLVTALFFVDPKVSLAMKAESLQSLLQGENNQPRFDHLIPTVADRLISAAGIQASQPIEDLLRPFFLRHLGDPRLSGKGAVRWQTVSALTQAIFKQWISKRDLELFFNIVEKTADDHMWRYRRKFWESYLPHIENTWVVLGPQARFLLRREQIEERQYGQLTSGALSNQSAFLIEMKGFVFIEWSHSGKLRAWRKSNFPFEFGKSQYSGVEIRSYCDEAWNHFSSEVYGWQNKVAQWIQAQCGITNSKSYRL